MPLALIPTSALAAGKRRITGQDGQDLLRFGYAAPAEERL